MTFKPNQIIDKRYKIIELLGQGGMGAVWRALDQQMGDEVVIKVPLSGSNEMIRKRFATEAHLMRKHSIGNPNIIDIQSVGTIDDTPYYVMRYLSGGSLEDRCPVVESGSAADFKQGSFEWLQSIGKALDYLHDHGVYHRDVKPANILFNKSGDAYLADFGIAKNPTEASTFTQFSTVAGTSPGTFGYMAPEVLDPDPDENPIGGASDQYALAVTLYESIAGQRPYDATNVIKLFRQTQKGCSPLSESFPTMPAAASEVVVRALASDQSKRFANCRDFADAFLDALRNPAPAVVTADVVPNETDTDLDDVKTEVLDHEKYREELARQKKNQPPGDSPVPPVGPNKPGRFDKPLGSEEPLTPRKPEPVKSSSPLPWIIAASVLGLALLGGGLYAAVIFSGSGSANNESKNLVELTNEEYRESTLTLVQEHADAGLAGAITELGYRADIDGDYETAIRFYLQAADKGDLRAQNNLGSSYAAGEGVEKDEAEAVRWFRKSADQGLAQAQLNLGFMFANGQGVKRDEVEAARWWQKAAEQGNARGQNSLGVSYANGEGVKQDEAEAARWYRKAADQGHANAQYNLGLMYRDGEGVGRSSSEAKKWFNKAATLGHEKAERVLAEIAKSELPRPDVAKDSVKPSATEKVSTPRFDLVPPDGFVAGKTSSFVAARFVKGMNDDMVQISVAPLSANNPWNENVNRWRRQVGLENAGEDQLLEQTQLITISGIEGKLVKLIEEHSGSDQGLIGAMVLTEDNSWFFKISGKRTLVLENEELFSQFLKDFTFKEK